MESIENFLRKIDIKENRRKDASRRKCTKEITRRLNVERERENEERILRYMWTIQVSRAKAIADLNKEKDPAKKIYSPYTERGIFFKTRHVETVDLWDLFDKCNSAEKDKRSFGKVFNGLLKVK